MSCNDLTKYTDNNNSPSNGRRYYDSMHNRPCISDVTLKDMGKIYRYWITTKKKHSKSQTVRIKTL